MVCQPDYRRCDCDGAAPCPLGHRGAEIRCLLTQLAVYFNCIADEAPDRLAAWQPGARAELDRWWAANRGRFQITIVSAGRPE